MMKQLAKPILLALGLGFAVIAFPLAQADDKGASPPPNAHQQMKDVREMRWALKHLMRSKKVLEKAPRKYDGHRAKALDLTNQAISEVKAAIEVAKQKK